MPKHSFTSKTRLYPFFSSAGLALSCLIPYSHLSAITSSWNVDAAGNWSTAGNWDNGVPNSATTTANFGNKITTARVVTLDINATLASITFDNANAYTLSQAAANAITLAPTSGGTSITIASGNGAHVIDVPITLGANLTVTQGSSNPVSLSGVISGAFSLTTAGTGITLIGASNTFTGGTTVSAGTLRMVTPSGLLAAGTVSVSTGATLDLNDNALSIGDLSGAGTITLGSMTTTTLTITTSAADTFSGAINGSGAVSVGGTGSLALSGVSNFSGGLTVTGGTVQLSGSGALNTAGNLTVNTPGTFDLNNLSQQIGILAGSGSITLGTATLLSNTSTGSTFSGVISGAGGFTLAGSSTLIFSNPQTYTGGTNIQGGTLQLNVANALASTGAVIVSGTLNLNNNSQTIGNLSGSGNITLGSAALTVTQTSPATFSGAIGAVSDTGSFILDGDSTLTLGAVCNYTGGTTVAGGELSLGIANALYATGTVTLSGGDLLLNSHNQAIGTLSGSQNITLGSAQLTVTQAEDNIYSGIISGTGSLRVQGTNILALTGQNNYTGTTTISGTGILQGNTTSLPGAIVNNANLLFNQLTAGTFSHSLTGTGTLYISGTAPLTLMGAPTQGSTLIQAGGTLIIASGSTLTSPTVTISSGGSLGFSGDIEGDVSCSGSILSGSGSSELIVRGTYTQAANSSFSFSVTPTTTDLLAVTDLITISPSASATVNPIDGTYQATQSYTVIASASDPVAGEFGSLILTFNPFFGGTLSYNEASSLLDVGTVKLTLEILPFSDVITKGNPGKIAPCFNAQTLPSDSPLFTLIQELIFLTVPQVTEALNQIQPSQLRSLTLQQENSLILTRSVISQRVDELYRTPCEQEASLHNSFDVWTNLSADFISQKGQSDNIGYASKTGVISLGVDAEWARKFFVGLAGFVDYTHLNWKNAQGKASIRGFYAGPYISFFGKRAFANLSALASWNHYSAVRHMNYVVGAQKATSTHSGFGTISHFDAGLLFYPGKSPDKEAIILHPSEASLSLSPFVGADYLYLHENAFSERGAGNLNSQIAASHASLIRGEAGLKLGKCSSHAHVKWIHDLKVSWVNEFRITGENLKASLEATGCSFTVTGIHPDRNMLDVETGLTGLFLEEHLQLSLRYEGRFAHRFNEQTGYFNGAFRF